MNRQDAKRIKLFNHKARPELVEGDTKDTKEKQRVDSRFTNHDSRQFGTAKDAKKNKNENEVLNRNSGDGRLQRHTGRG